MTTHKLFQGPTEMYCQNFVQTKVLARGPHTHNDYQSRLRVKGKTAPLQNGFCKTAPQRYETAQMQSRGGKDTMCVCVCGRRLDGCAVVGLQHIYFGEDFNIHLIYAALRIRRRQRRQGHRARQAGAAPDG